MSLYIFIVRQLSGGENPGPYPVFVRGGGPKYLDLFPRGKYKNVYLFKKSTLIIGMLKYEGAFFLDLSPKNEGPEARFTNNFPEGCTLL